MRTSIYAGSLVALLLLHAAIVHSAMPEPLPRRAREAAVPLADAAGPETERCRGACSAACGHGAPTNVSPVTVLAGER